MQFKRGTNYKRGLNKLGWRDWSPLELDECDAQTPAPYTQLSPVYKSMSPCHGFRIITWYH